MSGAIIKVCPCCDRRFTRDGWFSLGYVGIQRDPEDSALDHELRDCVCTSTIAVLVADLRKVAA